MSTYRAYSSANYTVFSRPEGVEILNIPSNATRWLQGDDAQSLLAELESYDRFGRSADWHLSQYFGE